MNILIPHQWLLEHLDTNTDPKDLQKNVSLCGPSIERIYDREGESVYDIEVTTNRVDSMSIRGIAREAAVILNQFGVDAQLKPLNLPEIKIDSQETLPLPKITNDPQLSKRVTCVVLKGVKRTPTPDWMAQRLTQVEMNVHDSAIDITNYITHELGHPCHAFDYDKVMNTGGEIIITEAKKGETFTTLDGNSFETLGGEVVFKNGEGTIIDLPSIKGTANTSIDDSTQNVLLLMESIIAPKVRFASMSHAIRTVAAQLMEKNVDPNLIIPTLQMGVKLYQELCGAEVASEIHDEFPGQKQPQTVELKISKIQEYLGLKLETSRIIEILESLECKVSHTKIDGEEILHVQPPTFRPDLVIPADIIEEIARIYGYHNLPSKLMDTAIPTNRPTHTNFQIENRIKRFLSATGWQEIYSYSLVSEKLATQSEHEIKDHLGLQNPLTEDKVYLRRSLLPSLNQVLDQNPLRKELSVFEIANVYHPQESDLPQEQLYLGLVSSKEYRQVRGDLESLLAQLYIGHVEIKQESVTQGQILILTKKEKTQIGTIEILANNRIGIMISMAQLLPIIKTHPTYTPIPKTALINEDLTFALEEGTAVGKILALIEEVNPMITEVNLKDQYNQNYTFEIKYHDPIHNLSREEIEPIRKEIITNVQNKFGAKLIGDVA